MDPTDDIHKLRQTIAALEGQRSVLGDQIVDASIEALKQKIDGLRPAHTQERKLVTILFCDIVGSSLMASDRDPEEVLHIVNGSLLEMNQAVESFGGTVTRYMGDGILAVFGSPRAQERHAEQAVRAGLALQERISAYAGRLRKEHHVTDFKVRVGINSGHVVGGHVGGERGEYTVIGDSVNRAARLCSLAGPGDVLISEETLKAVGHRVVTEEREPARLKGISKLVNNYTVKGLRYPDS